MDSLQLYRELLKRLDPTQPIQKPDQQPWYVERPDGVGTSLARNLQLEPTSSHLVVGPIGCGKSTELLAAGRVLLGTPGIFVRYIEVSRALDLSVADGAMLAIAVADDLVSFLSETNPDDPTLLALRSHLSPYVHGGYDPYHDVPDGDHGGAFGPTLKRPREIPEAMEAHLPTLSSVAEIIHVRYRGARTILLLDGLDRLSDPIEFDRIVEPFLSLLKAASIGVALVGPRRVISGLDRLGAAAAFDEIHWMGPVDPQPDGRGWTFLNQVLESRGVGEVVSDPDRRLLVASSGGAIRMLLQLTREAIKETWVRNASGLGLAQVVAAADKMGRSLLLGLTDAELAVLKALFETGTFGPRTPEESALALTNRVLEYRTPEGLPRHVVHPTLVPFVRALPKPHAPAAIPVTGLAV